MVIWLINNPKYLIPGTLMTGEGHIFIFFIFDRAHIRGWGSVYGIYKLQIMPQHPS